MVPFIVDTHNGFPMQTFAIALVCQILSERPWIVYPLFDKKLEPVLGNNAKCLSRIRKLIRSSPIKKENNPYHSVCPWSGEIGFSWGMQYLVISTEDWFSSTLVPCSPGGQSPHPCCLFPVFRDICQVGSSPDPSVGCDLRQSALDGCLVSEAVTARPLGMTPEVDIWVTAQGQGTWLGCWDPGRIGGRDSASWVTSGHSRAISRRSVSWVWLTRKGWPEVTSSK